MYSIKQLSVLTGIKAHTIRIWEKRYSMFSPSRTETNIRRYSDADLRLALNIKLLLSLGYKISRIASMSSDEMVSLINKGSNVVGTPTVPESLLSAAIRMDEKAFVETFNEVVNARGFEWTYEKMLIPFQRRMGLLWQSGGIVPAQEHFTSNLLRNAIIKASQDVKVKPSKESRILFYLPEDELHEIGLLYFNYIAQSEGYSTIYLGQSVPFDDIVSIAKKQNVAMLFTALTVAKPDDFFVKHFANLQAQLSNTKIGVTGYQVEQGAIKIPSNVAIVSSATDFKNYLLLNLS